MFFFVYFYFALPSHIENLWSIKHNILREVLENEAPKLTYLFQVTKDCSA